MMDYYQTLLNRNEFDIGSGTKVGDEQIKFVSGFLE